MADHAYHATHVAPGRKPVAIMAIRVCEIVSVSPTKSVNDGKMGVPLLAAPRDLRPFGGFCRKRNDESTTSPAALKSQRRPRFR